jgi:hypothetical protein
VFVVSRGRVKLSLCAADGKTLILRVAEAGEMLGIGATVCGRPYEATAETMETSEISHTAERPTSAIWRSSVRLDSRNSCRVGNMYEAKMHPSLRQLGQ